MISPRDHVAHLAEIDALAFVETFQRPFEGSEDDSSWLDDAWRKAAEDAGLTESEAAALSRLYRQELRSETRRLSQENAS